MEPPEASSPVDGDRPVAHGNPFAQGNPVAHGAPVPHGTPVAHGAYAAHGTPEPRDDHPMPEAGEAQDDEWAGETRAAAGCAALLLALSLTIDAGTGSLSTVRAVLWIGVATLLFVILTPSRVSAAPGQLTVRGLWTRHTVRTDRLRSVRWSNGVSQRLVLRDAEDNRAEIDPRVLVANPALWHRVAADARRSAAQGTLLCGATALDQLARRIDRETAETVFKVSGLR
ncbi:hypothetical protein [Streptomyces sp. NPDC047981]|uniref:hypothetical protein n=1 Tax=Streptomyces sp. NPDC047981 TaxID=3154610 RepID=UPI0034425976